jgi:proline iminopeptidase
MLTLYPAIQPYKEHRLPVEAPHELYIEECGNPDGIPLVIIHGGPGAGSNENYRRYFDPTVYRIILFDQRGAGRSTPHAELAGNTTPKLVEDMEAIREYLNIQRWILCGGSWGSTLGLVYAETHPQRVLSMIFRGIFLCRPQEIKWFYEEGAHHIFPDYWEDFLAPIPADQRHNAVRTYYELLTGSNEVARMAAAKAWATWEARCSTLEPSKHALDYLANPHTALSLARVECHYFIHNCFMEPNQILRNVDRIQHIPGIIVHGRYDVVCPINSAWELHKAWNNSELHIIRTAGHSGSEPGIIDALVRAGQQMSKRISGNS